MRIAILLTTFALLAFTVPATADPDFQGLADDLRSEDAMRLGTAVRTLLQMPHDQCIRGAPILAPPIIELFDHPDVRRRATALRWIVLFRGGVVDVWTPVVAKSTDPDPGTRAAALDTLGILCTDSEEGEKRLLPHLLIGLTDPSWQVRWKAGELAANLSISIEILVPALTMALELKGKALARKNPKLVAETRRALVTALARAGEKAVPALAALTEALEDDDGGVRAGAANALGRIGEAAREAEKSLADTLKDDEPGVRAAAATALAGIGASDTRTAKALGKLLRDKSPEVVFAAAETMSALPTLAASEVTALQKALGHDSAMVRAAAATALGAVGPGASRAVSALKKVAERDEDPAARSAAEQALELIGAE